MGSASRSLSLIRRSAAPALALIVVGTFAGHAIAGPNGILAWGSYHRALHQRQAELAQLEQQKAELKHRDRKSTRLNSSHPSISYAVFCLNNIKLAMGRVC